MKILTPYLLLLILRLGVGCSPACKLRKAKRLIEQAQNAGLKWSSDTVKVNVPVFVDRIALDTLLISRPSDTVYLEKDRLRLKYVKLPGDTVWISAECDSITVFKEVPLIVNREIIAPHKIKWWWLVVAGCVGGFITLLVVGFRR